MSVEDKVSQAVALDSAPPLSAAAQVGMVSIVASIISTLLIRVAARTSFVILSFYVGKESESAALVVVVIEAFYVSELLLAPLIGVLSDRHGRKRYMLYAPVAGASAATMLAITAFFFPKPNLGASFSLELVAILLLVLVGRLLEGVSAALNAPSNLGYLTDSTVGDDKLRVRVMTAYEIVTVAGIALAIPFGGQVWNLFGRGGFFVAVAIYGLCLLVISVWMKESLTRSAESQHHGSINEYREILTNKRIFTFVPAWLAIMALIGAWLTLSLIILSYPTSQCRISPEKASENIRSAVSIFRADYCIIEPGKVDADVRFPNQLLHGGFTPTEASSLVGIYGVLFIAGMALWTFIVPRMRRTTVMLIGLVGLILSCGGLFFINNLGNNPMTLSADMATRIWFLAPLVIVGVLIMSGFTPAALTHLAAISETLPGKRGAVMGLYSVLLGVGQLVGVFIGGIFVDWDGFNGLMIYSVILGVISLASVLYMRSHRHDIDDHLEGRKLH